MSIRFHNIKERIARIGRWLLHHDDRIFGVVLSLMAVEHWIVLLLRLQEYSVFLRGGVYASPLLSLMSIAFSALYVSIIAAILLTAPKPLARYQTIWPNFLAVIAGFGVYAFGLLTPSETHPFGIQLPLLLLITGTAIVLLSLLYLRRAFSVTPQARTVVRNGPYAFIRHPMYVGNILSITGLGLLLGTLEALLLALAACLLQVCRARFEDRLLVATFVDHGTYVSDVNAFIPWFSHRKLAWILLLLASFASNWPDWSALAQTRKRVAEMGPTCLAWHQKALSGQWFTKNEGKEFLQWQGEEESLARISACADFFKLQNKCEDAYFGTMTAANKAEENRRNAALRNTIESVSGCTSILGVEIVCGELKKAVASGKQLSPRLRSIFGQCADETIAARTSSMIREGL